MSVLATFIVYLHIDLVRPSISIYRQIVIWFPCFFISPNICNDFFLHYTFWQQQQIDDDNIWLKICWKNVVSRLTAAIWLLLFKSSSCFYFLYQLLQSCLVVSCLSFFSRDRHHATVYQKYYNLVQMYPKYNKYTEN